MTHQFKLGVPVLDMDIDDVDVDIDIYTINCEVIWLSFPIQLYIQ